MPNVFAGALKVADVFRGPPGFFAPYAAALAALPQPTTNGGTMTKAKPKPTAAKAKPKPTAAKAKPKPKAAAAKAKPAAAKASEFETALLQPFDQAIKSGVAAFMADNGKDVLHAYTAGLREYLVENPDANVESFKFSFAIKFTMSPAPDAAVDLKSELGWTTRHSVKADPRRLSTQPEFDLQPHDVVFP